MKLTACVAVPKRWTRPGDAAIEAEYAGARRRGY